MDYNTLIAAKGTPGSIANFVNYTKLDTVTILDEAQTLIYSMLRTREMRVSASVTLLSGASSVALPGASTGQFLEPVSMIDASTGTTLIPRDDRFVSPQKLLELRSVHVSPGVPANVAVFDEAFQFDVSPAANRLYTLIYYKRPDLLSGSNTTNWLTSRYPQILRTACQAAAADFMKDDEEYTKAFTRLQSLIQATNQESSLTDASGVTSSLNKPQVEGSLLSFIPPGTTPAQAVFAEAQQLIYSMLRTREMRVSTTLTLLSGASSVALPGASTGQFLEPVSMLDSGSGTTLIPSDDRFVSPQKLQQLQFLAQPGAIPSHVSIIDEAFEFDATAPANRTYALVYYKRPDLLTDTTQSNWLTSRYPQILRTAAQAVAADFVKNDDEYVKVFARLKNLIDAANAEAALPEGLGITSSLNKAQVEGSLLSFIADGTTPVQAVLAEAQQLLYSVLRTREMITDYAFTMPVGNSYVALPARFLDPIGRISLTSIASDARHKDAGFIRATRIYDPQTGTLGAAPFTTAVGSTAVNVALANHSFTQDSVFSTAGATAANGVTINGTFPITAIVDTGNFTIDISSLNALPTGAGAGGGAAVTYSADVLWLGTPIYFGIWNERLYFESAFSQATNCRMQYYQSLPLLTKTSDSNFLTTRYAQLFRIACQAAEANMRQDAAAYAAAVQKLTPMVQVVNVENDESYRGMELDPITP